MLLIVCNVTYLALITYFENNFWMEFLPIVNALKASNQLGYSINPEKISDLKPTASTIDKLKVFASGECHFKP